MGILGRFGRAVRTVNDNIDGVVPKVAGAGARAGGRVGAAAFDAAAFKGLDATRALGRGGMSGRVAAGSVIAGAAVLGVGSSLTDSEGPWRQKVYPGVQDIAFGNPTMFQDSLKAALTTEYTLDPNEDVLTPTNYYYGRPVNLRGNERLGQPVSGEMVFGMYNLRR